MSDASLRPDACRSQSTPDPYRIDTEQSLLPAPPGRNGEAGAASSPCKAGRADATGEGVGPPVGEGPSPQPGATGREPLAPASGGGSRRGDERASEPDGDGVARPQSPAAERLRVLTARGCNRAAGGRAQSGGRGVSLAGALRTVEDRSGNRVEISSHRLGGSREQGVEVDVAALKYQSATGRPTALDCSAGRVTLSAVESGREGVRYGASAVIAECGGTVGRFTRESASDEQLRIGLSAGMAFGLRLHRSDEDEDGHPERGLGVDIGPLSIDWRSESWSRTLLPSLRVTDAAARALRLATESRRPR